MGLFHHDGSSTNHTCPSHSLSETPVDPLFGNTSFHRFDVIFSGACAAFALVVTLVHKQLHAMHYLKPNEQVKIMRIGFLISFYAIFSFLSVAFPGAYVYLRPWLDFIESIAMGSFFLLLCEYISPSAEKRDVFFAALNITDKKHPGRRVDGLAWFKTSWTMVFQFPIISLLVAILTAITQAAGVYCQWESKVYFARLWLRIIGTASLAFAIIAVLRFYAQLKQDLKGYRALLKLVSFKFIVFLTFIQSIIFWILSDTNTLNGTSTMTFADLNVGVPNLLICIELVPISLLYCYAYPWTPYLKSRATVGTIADRADSSNSPSAYQGPQTYQGGLFGLYAWFDMLNPIETIQAIAFGIRLFGERAQSGKSRSDSYPSDQDDERMQNQWYGGRRQDYPQAPRQQNRFPQ